MNSVNLIANLIIICIGVLIIWYLVGKVVDELMVKTNEVNTTKFTNSEIDNLLDALQEWSEVVGPKEVEDNEVGLNSERYAELVSKLKHDPVVQGNEVALGDPITVGDDLDGATLCDWCGNHFKSDGNIDRCNECVS